ncbi:MAG: G5 domain-containing protein [Clostridia bacterium]|nr:G5 domain-containing protein [Clostridia bacterium]
MKDEKYIPGEEEKIDAAATPSDTPADDGKEEVTPEENAPAADEAPETEAPDAGDAAEESEEAVSPDAEGEHAEDASADEAVDEYAIEDEPFVRKATPEEIAFLTQRITGEEHSRVTTAAPVRTRNPEQNRNVTNGIPSRGQAQRTSHPIHREVQPKKKSGLFPVIVTAALLVAAMLTSVVVGVNLAYSDKEDNRPSDFDMIETEHSDAASIDSLSTKPAVDTGDTAETEPDEPGTDTADTAAETDPVEPDTETAEPETAPAETTPPETQPPETEPPAPKYTIKLDFYDRDDIVISTEQTTLRTLLADLSVTLKDSDRPNIGLDDVIAADTTVQIDQVLYQSATVTEAIAYETEVIEIDTIPRGDTNYLQYGEEGSKNLYYTVEYINGQETNRTLDWEEVTKWPVNEKYELGVGGTFVGADGVTYTYSLRRVVPATYYDLTGPTYLGPDADETVIAVDKNNIPLGTMLYVKNDKYDFGLRMAADVGPKVNEWQIDIWLSHDNPQFESFSHTGYHYDMEIYYVDVE